MSSKTGYGLIVAACFMAVLFAGQPGFGAGEDTSWMEGENMGYVDPPPDPDFPDTSNLDPDGDDVANRWDNCPDVANPRQKDKDGDGIGDACDDSDGNYHRALNAWLEEKRLEHCTEVAKRYPTDTDRDGILDACDKMDEGGECQQFMTAGGTRNFPLEPAYAVYEDSDVCYSYLNACAIPSWMTQQAAACPQEDYSAFHYMGH